MATPQLSPGIITREVDLTVGRAENVLDNIGAIAGPFSIGPVDLPIDISTEKSLLDVYGKPSTGNDQYEYWMSASSYLSYGGILKVVRCDDINLNNSNAAVTQASRELKIKNFDDYTLEYSEDESQNFYFASKNPGTWANNLKVCVIDDVADQILQFNTVNFSSLEVTPGCSVTKVLNNVSIPGNGTIETFSGVLKALVTQVDDELNRLHVKITSRVSNSGVETLVTYSESISYSAFSAGDLLTFRDQNGNFLGLDGVAGAIEGFTFDESGVENSFEADEVYTNVPATGGSGIGASFTVTRTSTGTIGIVTITSSGSGYSQGQQLTIPGSSIGSGGQISFTSFSGGSVLVSEADGSYLGITGITTSGTGVGAIFNVTRDSSGEVDSVTVEEEGFQYANGSLIRIPGSVIGGVDNDDDINVTVLSISDRDLITITLTSVDQVTTLTPTSAIDWYNQQTLNLDNSVVFWRSIAEKPVTTDYALQRSSINDGIHIVVVDDSGSISGIQVNILEKHLYLSKSRDAISSVNSPTKIWYKDYLANFSKYIFAGTTPSSAPDSFHETNPSPSGFLNNSYVTKQVSDGIWGRNAQGVSFNVIGNKTYTLSGGRDYSSGNATLSNLSNSYDLFSNKEEYEIDFLIYGPSLSSEIESQAKANKLISIAESRKDCIAVISPHRNSIVNITNSEDQTNNIVRFFSPLISSSYAVFDSGYKYTYDRFNNQFRYIPCNADIAGLMARTNLNSFPWFSPAGQQRGVLNNAIKLAYTPNKDQRDRLYKSRINSIINQPGAGIILYGDKTALTYASAFDRINVRRLFLTVEQALERAANSQLFEFNDQATRSNFINIIEPYLRDVQAKRGVFDFRVICDESNNTPDVIDNNEFRADIFLKPTRSINYITLTFVATRSGVSFEEVAGNV